jgi:hypothetical protein
MWLAQRPGIACEMGSDTTDMLSVAFKKPHSQVVRDVERVRGDTRAALSAATANIAANVDGGC